jgi:hypothetical protein
MNLNNKRVCLEYSAEEEDAFVATGEMYKINPVGFVSIIIFQSK